MPKLSAYVAEEADQRQRAHPVAADGPGGKAASARRQEQQQQQRQGMPGHQQQQQSTRTQLALGAGELEQQHGAAAAKLQAEYAKRVAEHGGRLFRHPDGSLRSEPPPPNPQAVANRRLWAPLVQHCRIHGGDRSYERQGYSLRYGLGVTAEQHAAYLAGIGLQPEAGPDGQHLGVEPGPAGPLEDAEHCFNSYYKEGAEAVFKDKRGRLL